MDIEMIGNALEIAVVVTIAIVMTVAAIIYAFIKKKRNYNSTGIPKRVEKLNEHEGKTNDNTSGWEPGGPVEVVGAEEKPEEKPDMAEGTVNRESNE
jgi:hypothetical protein